MISPFFRQASVPPKALECHGFGASIVRAGTSKTCRRSSRALHRGQVVSLRRPPARNGG
jgi:hypothetical protein